ncbi:MAG: family 78 glycoside hydrolase catalytic domain, partial [Lachnospiraceae bacterium]|nr:family 78 glycoside hydrolase catalytic domain [Lachnospiraceae bacterium]
TGLVEEAMEEDSEEIEEKEEVEEFFEEEMPDNVIVIATDETWGYYASDIESCGIGKGEVFNRLLWAEKDNPDKDVEVLDLDIPLVERYAEPISVLEELKPEEVIKNAVGEELLDFGKPFTGYVSFTSNLPKGTKVVLDYVDDPDEENEQPVFTYIADGDPEVVGTRCTYFKGRYVKVRGWDGELNPEDFTGYIVLPEEPEEIEEVVVPEEVMEPEEEESLQTGFIETSDENLNRLFDNIFARQENLFLDNSEVEEQAEELSEESAEPIDKFTAAACYNMDVKEGIENLLTEQSGKSLVTVPWTLYNMYGDKESLENHYDAMKAYVDETVAGVDGYLKESEEFLPYDENSDATFIASANYYEAADLVAKAAKTLEKEEDAEKYGKVAEAVRVAILDEYFTASGRNFLSTQEELVTALRTGIYNNKERLVNDLKANFKEAYYQITCGAEETPSLCKTLADNGMEDLAYKLLLEINTYGWLYGVEESDTAIWTSRDAIQEDGTVDAEIQEADDSLEYGAVAEFLYAYVLGIKPLEPGFKKIELAPIPTSNLIYANGEFQSPVGKIVSGWEVLEDGKIQIHFEIPEGTIAKVLLPACEDATIAEQELEAGTYEFEYMPTKDYIHLFNENSTIGDILKYQESLEIIEEINPELAEKIQNADLGVYAEPLDFIENLGIESEQAAEIKETIFRLI